MIPLSDQVDSCLAKLQSFVDDEGKDIGSAAAAEISEIVLWLNYFEKAADSHVASELLSGARSFVVESISYLSLGLGRAAIAAIRGQVDLLTSYTFFRDHPNEWRLVQHTGKGFKLRKAVFDYHENGNPGFKSRLGTLEAKYDYSLVKIYQILSAHLHAQATIVVPTTKLVDEIVLPKLFVRTIVELQGKTALAISNFLLAVYAKDWPDLPPEVVTRVKNVLDPQKRPKFFGDAT